MSTKSKIVDNKEVKSVPYAMNSLKNMSDDNNTSNNLHTSHNSEISNESELSLLSLSFEKELESTAHVIDIDELPAFEIRLISPLGRTPSPIDAEDVNTPSSLQILKNEWLTPSPCLNNPEFVAVHDINARISPPSENEDEIESSISRTSSLETIYEGVFLNTPPKYFSSQNNRKRTNLLEKVTLNRLNIGKENVSPTLNYKIPFSHRTSADIRCVTSPRTHHKNHTFS